MRLTTARSLERGWQSLATVARLRDSLAPFLGVASYKGVNRLGARVESSRFIRGLPASARSFASPRMLREWVVSQPAAGGMFLEFGVAGAESTNELARRMAELGVPSPIYGFDSFRGLPEDWRPGVRAGAFHQDNLPRVDDNVTLVVGPFEQSLPPFLQDHPSTVAFAHIDCDLYSSARFVLSTMVSSSRLVPGSVLLFDDLINFPGWNTDGEYRALTEVFPTENLTYEFIAVAPVYHQVALRILPK